MLGASCAMRMQDKAGRRVPGRPFKPGEGGRPKGAIGGRQKLVNALDVLLAKEGNQKKMIAAWQSTFNDDPMRFWNRVIVPLLPKESLVKVLGGSEMGRGLVDAVRMALAARVEESRPETTDADSKRPTE